MDFRGAWSSQRDRGTYSHAPLNDFTVEGAKSILERFSLDCVACAYALPWNAEVDLAFRNHGAHLEVALKHDITPVSSHYQVRNVGQICPDFAVCS